MKAAACSLALVVTMALPAWAQQPNTWSYEKLQQKADLVLIVHAESGRKAAPALGAADERLIPMESTLKVLVPLKGDSATGTVTLIHYVSKSGIDEPVSKLVPLKYGSRQVTFNNFDGTVQEVTQPACQYLVFLKRRADGKYEPATGHHDSLTSIVELPHRYVELPSAPAHFTTASADRPSNVPAAE